MKNIIIFGADKTGVPIQTRERQYLIFLQRIFWEAKPCLNLHNFKTVPVRLVSLFISAIAGDCVDKLSVATLIGTCKKLFPINGRSGVEESLEHFFSSFPLINRLATSFTSPFLLFCGWFKTII